MSQATAILQLIQIFVVDYAQPPQSAEGNSYFLEQGALPLRSNREGQPNLKKIFQVFNTSGFPVVTEF